MENVEVKSTKTADFLDKDLAEVVIQNANVRLIVKDHAVHAGFAVPHEQLSE
ncbi:MULTISPECIES: hypothetical protein [Aeromonas]|uniref:hypothetical protein n=1 Tax=Aeromonas TaxID=642 RepID=UPI0014560961|nr:MULTISPECIES: hypothetical protein [Aeromonas]